jgi:hypothetical protein
MLLLSAVFSAPDYPLKDGKPTSKGIRQYVEDKSDSLVLDYQAFVGDTIYNVWFYAEDLGNYDVYDSMELGRYYPEEIFINTAERFLAYELADLTRFQRNKITETNRFVKAAMIHELTHDYIHQISLEMRSRDSILIDRAYQTSIWIIRSQEPFGTEFIEEGLCEYMVEQMGELIPPKRVFIPSTKLDLIDRNNRYKVNYKYGSYFLRPFLDTTGFKRGVKILLSNPPPTFIEILEPDRFFSRLHDPLD